MSLGQRVIVVLKAPSLAQQVAAAGGIASTADERRWTSAAYAAQQQLITALSVQGIGIKPEYSFARVLNGFSAALDPGAIALLERSDAVAGVYPVRAAFPASVSSSVLESPSYGPASGHRPNVQLPGYDGRGVTVALLDTGVDRAQPYLRGRVLPGIDVVGGDEDADAAADPGDPSRHERSEPSSRACSSAAAARAGSPASRRVRACSRSASPAGSSTRAAAMPSTRAATRSCRGSSAPSTRTTTATPTTPRASR